MPKSRSVRTDRPPLQARSRETLERLLSAAEELLQEGGLEAATVPAIAERAGVSVGIVYRRFADKDDLLRAVYERYFHRMRERNRGNLELASGLQQPFDQLARNLILGMLEGYRRNRGILRALIHYARTHSDPDFRRAAHELNREGMKMIAELLLRHRHRIRHPDPAAAIEFGLIAVAAVLHTTVLEDETVHGLRAPAKLGEELVRLFLGYLGQS